MPARIVRFALPLLMGLFAVSAQAQLIPCSPARLIGIINRQEPPFPQVWFTSAELDVLASRFELVTGLDGHGYNYPGALDQLLAVNPGVVALAYFGVMSIQQVDPIYGQFDEDETVFLHTADPASLVAIGHDGKAILWFTQDGRNIAVAPLYTPPGVIEYLVEVSPSQGAPFSPLGSPVPETGAPFYRVEDPILDADRSYRVRSRLTSGAVVDYSWVKAADTSATSTLATASQLLNGQISVRCYGDCPTDPADLTMVSDFNNDRLIAPSERTPFSAVITEPDGAMLYSGAVTIPPLFGPYSYHVERTGLPAVRDPLQGAYGIIPQNNRIYMPINSSLHVWADHPTWMNFVKNRLSDAMTRGYQGIRLDFALDSLQMSWVASGVLSDWNGPGDLRVKNAVATFLQELQAHEPTAMISINGRWTALSGGNYFDFLDAVDMGDIEFFAIGNNQFDTQIQGNTFQSMLDTWEMRNRGEQAALLSAAHETNLVGRIKSYVMYLLTMDDETFLYNYTDLLAQEIGYLPEYEVPLGEPLTQVRAFADIQPYPSVPNLLVREFENGFVFYNADNVTWPIDIAGPAMYEVSITGGRSPRIGGNGSTHYTQTNLVNLLPGDAAIVTRTNGAPGDLDCDGDRDGHDVSAFVLALIDPARYTFMYPTCDITRSDLNTDGDRNGEDIASFVTTMTTQACP